MPLLLQPLHQGQFVGRLDFAMHFVDAELGAHRPGRGQAVARRHDDAQATVVQRLDGVGRGCLDRVGDGQDACQPPVHGQVHHAATLAAQALCVRLERIGGHVLLLHQGGVAQHQMLAFDRAAHADAAARFEVVGLAQRQPLVPGGADDGIRQRVLAALIQTGRQAQHLIRRVARVGDGGVEGRLAFGQGAGLVHDQRIHFAHFFDGAGIAE